jgi:hypothetical protein
MARNLQLLDANLGISCNVKYEPLNMSDKDKPKVTFKSRDGKEVKLTTVGENRTPVTTFRAYLDADGKEYAKADLIAYAPDTNEVIDSYESTSIFNIKKYEPVTAYTDHYVVDKFYELSPSDDGKKKEIDRRLANDINLTGMKKLWDHLIETNTVAKAEFIATAGYRPGAGYIRAIKINGTKWSLELGCFKEMKIFRHLQERSIKPVEMIAKPTKRRANALV